VSLDTGAGADCYSGAVGNLHEKVIAIGAS
jgi:hypothetical protein